jgi:hypothetical protein
MHAPLTDQLDRSPTAPSLVPQAARLGATPDCRSAWRQRRGRQSVDDPGPRRGADGPPPSLSARRGTPLHGGATRPCPRTPPTLPDHLRVSGRRVDPETDRRGDAPRVRCHLPPDPGRPPLPGDPLEPTNTRPARPPTRRSGHHSLARRHLARPQQGAEAQQHTLLFREESGCYPLPSVVRTYAPIGQPPIVREWCTRDHVSAISAISPAGKVYFHSQDCAINSGDVVAGLEPLMREVSGRMSIMWDGAPMHRRHLIQAFLANGAPHQLHLERLPAYAPELNPGEGLWHSSQGSTGGTCAVAISHSSGMNAGARCDTSDENRASFEGVSRAQDFR